ncbi:thiamine pyrophosphate-dependent enzyme [Halanaerobium sp. MA284_MarDTE_T2]|uniref:thiamine pyrophosphate-dependent enzyme n=1 Tax=Halanaerobium sp. MA284_MarDTE_T2 TaxID=2183913 RepID=UPI000DF2EBBB|nr:thiamine pyrophosphate-dependent enzyme [Halanaerobium sp. MA284_MarDTE_T2]RCW44389.1 2-oxoglutarate ferredoxin oxidoreductase beta subunit [Halanaerobium sp. MA284_MarDTE_T2]
MLKDIEHPLQKYIRPGTNYTTCPGCGNGILAQSTLRAIKNLELDFDNIVFVSGIGCAGWIPSPSFNTDVLHVTHGRAIAYATGVKLTNPKLKVVVFSGDGDLSAIGGNHFIHAARRNIDLTVICVNNRIYGMTSGQAAPTTPKNSKTTTTPYGNMENTFDLSDLAKSAGATFVARWTTYHARQLTKSIAKAIDKKGFSFIEAISQCPVHYGKVIGMRNDAPSMMKEFKSKSIHINKIDSLSNESSDDKIIVGELVNENEKAELTDLMQSLRTEVGTDG